MLCTHEATLHANGTLSFRDRAPLEGSHRVLVTILDEVEPSLRQQAVEDMPPGDIRRTLSLLDSAEFRSRAYGAAALMERIIHENRSEWDE